VWRSFWQISGKAPCVVVFGTNAGAIVPAVLDDMRLGTSGALLSSDDYGSSVERTAKLHPLWQCRTDVRDMANGSVT
jgi:hypothetical protein